MSWEFEVQGTEVPLVGVSWLIFREGPGSRQPFWRPLGESWPVFLQIWVGDPATCVLVSPGDQAAWPVMSTRHSRSLIRDQRPQAAPWAACLPSMPPHYPMSPTLLFQASPWSHTGGAGQSSHH